MIEIVNYIQNEIRKIPEIKHFDLWNNQILNEQKEKPFWTPAVFLDFSDIGWDVSMAQGSLSNVAFRQKGQIRITLWLVVESKWDNIKTFQTLLMPLRNLITAQLQYKTIPEYGVLIRESEEYDNDHDNITYWKITFLLQAAEQKTDETLIEAQTILKLSLTQPIENQDIRSSKLESEI